MACGRLRELALLDVDDGLAADERAELDAHLAGCADCRAARDAARRVARGVRQLPVPPVPLGFSERTLQRLERAQSVEARPRVRLARFAAAAALLAAAAVFWIERERAAAPKNEQVAERRFAADAENQELDLLADGDGADAPARKQAPQDEEKARTNEKGEESPPPPGSVAPPVTDGAAAESAADAVRAEGGLNERDKNLKDQGERSDEERRKLGESGARDAGGAADAGKAGVATKFEEQKKSAGLDAAAPAFDELVRDLARGTPAEALHKIGALADAGRDGEQRLEKWAEKPAAAAEKAKAAPTEKAASDDAKRSPDVAPPPLRFVRAHATATRVADLIGARGEQLARDDAGRFVVELTEDEAKALETRLAAAGVKVETVVASDWLAALRESELRARARAVVADGAVRKAETQEPKGPPTKAPGAPPAEPTSGKSRGAAGVPAKEAPKPGAPALGAGRRQSDDTKPPPRVRWFLLAGE